MKGGFTIRRAGETDADAIADAHRDSIRTIGPAFYSLDVVEAWASGLSRVTYVNAMRAGEIFFVAIGTGGPREILGFSTHRIDGATHATAVYVRGTAARQGIGSALFREAEADAIRAGAGSLEVSASLAAEAFYRANGFEETGRGHHRLGKGTQINCVFMRKLLGTPRPEPGA